jgi:hypothetical protein
MGWDIVAYYDIDQTEIDTYISSNSINKDNWDECDIVAKYYKDIHLPKDATLYPVYQWNDSCNIHEMYEMYGVNFIRDDKRFDNRRYQKELEKKIGRPFPECLRGMNWTVSTSKDALEVARELEVFFPDDIDMAHFAKWLRKTAQYCSTYELSY